VFVCLFDIRSFCFFGSDHTLTFPNHGAPYYAFGSIRKKPYTKYKVLQFLDQLSKMGKMDDGMVHFHPSHVDKNKNAQIKFIQC